jgi:FkbM family methyltransferase
LVWGIFVMPKGHPFGFRKQRSARNIFYFLLYQIHGTCLRPGWKVMRRRLPRVMARLDPLKALVSRLMLPRMEVWVRAQSGLAKGMWMQVRLPEEASHWRGEHEPQLQSAIATMIPPGAVVYDVGAHIGTITLGAARLVGSTGYVVAFDGDPENTERLRQACVRNEVEAWVQVVHAAVWSHSARDGVGFRLGGRQSSQGGVEEDGYSPVLGRGEIVKVPAITLDEFIAVGRPVPQLIKIDVEGGEYEVLRGGATLFARQRPLAVIEIHQCQAAKQIAAWLKEQQYCAYWDVPREEYPQTVFAWPREYAGILPREEWRVARTKAGTNAGE